jgi:hypothetical protein
MVLRDDAEDQADGGMRRVSLVNSDKEARHRFKLLIGQV